MPECHTCPHNRPNDKACLACPGPYKAHPQGEPGQASLYHHGANHVSVDAVVGFIPAPEPTEPPTDYDAAVAFVRALAGLGFIEREIVFSRLQGQQYPQITSRINLVLAKKMTIQAVHARAKKATRDPAIGNLFHEMIVKQQKRKAYHRTKQTAANETAANTKENQ